MSENKEEVTFQYAHAPETFTLEDAIRREDENPSEWLVVHFDCPTGQGMLTAHFRERICDIHDFAVKGEQRKGDGRKTLVSLKKYFDIMDVPNPVAWQFWRTMRHENLVRDLFGLDEGYEDRETTGSTFPPIAEGDVDLCMF